VDQIKTLIFKFRLWLQNPVKVLGTCFTVFIVTLLLNGTVWKIWGLGRDAHQIEAQILSTQFQVVGLNNKLQLIKNDAFMERTARDKLDFAGEKDLIFVFPE
jgi:hypothetical protein